MLISVDPNQGAFYIRSYAPGSITVNDQIIHHSIILTPNQLINPWDVNSFEDLNEQQLQKIIGLSPEIVILGAGEQQHFLPAKLTNLFLEKNMGLEVMQTYAACKTYNILIAEGRKVIVGLIV